MEPTQAEPQTTEPATPAAPTDDGEQSGFSQAFESPSAPATTTPQPAAPTPEKAGPADTPAQSEPEAPKYRQLTEQEYQTLMDRTGAIDQIRADNKRAFDTVFGQMGGLKQQVMERLQSQTTAGAPVELTADDLADLNADYPELGERLLKSLQKIAPKLRGTGAAASPPQPLVTPPPGFVAPPAPPSIPREVIDRQLDTVLPNWIEQVRKPEFRTWMDTQAPEIQALEASDVPRDAAVLLRLYGQHLATPPKPDLPQKPTVSARQRQLEAAVNPRSVAVHTPVETEEQAFLSAFEK